MIASPMSFRGSAARAWRLTHIHWVLVPVAMALILAWWSLVFVWYAIVLALSVAFRPFGLAFVGYRLVRRSDRSNRIERREHRQLLEALRRSEGLGSHEHSLP